MRRLTAVATIALLLIACGCDSAPQQPGHGGDGGNGGNDGNVGAVGTSGRAPGTVSAVLRAEPPVFVSHDRVGTRLWNITQQVYQ